MTVTPVKSGRGEICPTLSFLGRLAVWTPLSALPPANVFTGNASNGFRGVSGLIPVFRSNRV